MKVGMLWFDNDPETSLKAKIERAAEYYSQKYGQKPNLCFVHPKMLAGDPERCDGIDIRATHQVLPNHFWLGMEEEK
jgi:hypothetical protein